ncbi:kinesin, partial [Thraustotheca clavata]
MAENVQVFCRVRPPNARELIGGSARRCVSTDATESTSLVLASQVQAKKEPPRNFFFDRVFGERSTQEQVFEVVGRPITRACLEGYNGTIFAYGQTGSGKTFTMLGEEDQAGRANLNKGLVPRVLEYLFEQQDVHEGSTEFEAASTVEYKYICSFLEIYNERVFDLLDSTTTENGLNLRENHIKGVFVEGLKEMVVENAQQATDLMVLGTQNRHVGHTSMNRESSRSHSVFILQIHSKETTTSGLIKKRQARFNLVDLAGSERQKSTEAAGERLKEAGNINKSLSALGNVIMALSEQAVGKTRHVHYRDSKLTYLLKDSLGGNSKTFMIAAISPAEDCMSETHSTLKFAQRAKMIKNNAFINEDTTGNVQLLQEEIKRLRLQLQQQGGNNNPNEPSFPIPSNFNPFSELNDNPLPVDCDPVVDTRFRDLENTLSNIVDEHTTQKREMEVLQMRESQYQELCAQLKRKMLHLRFLLKLRADKESNVEHIERIQQELEYNPSVDSLEWRIKYDDMERMYYDLQEEYNQLRDGGHHTDEVARIQQMHFDIAKQLSFIIQDKHILQDRLGNTNGVVEAMPDNQAIVSMEAKISQAQALQNLAEEELAKNLLETQRLRERVQNQDVKVSSQQILIEDQDQQIRVLQEVLMNERAVREESVAIIKRDRDQVIDALKQRCLEWEYRVAMMTQERNNADSKARAIESQLHEVKSVAQMKVAALEQKLAAAEENTKQLASQVDLISNEKSELQRLLNESVAREALGNEQLANIQTQLENSALEIKNLTLALRQSEVNLVTAQTASDAQAFESKSRIEAFQDEVASLVAKIEGLETDHVAISEALDAKDDTLQATIGDVERVAFELREAKKTLETKQAEFDLDLADKTQQINALYLTISELEATLKTTKEEADSAIQSLQKQVQELEMAKSQLEHTVQELEAASSRHTEASEVQVNELREALEAKEDTLQATIDDLEQISHNLDTVKAELAQKELQWAEAFKKLENEHLAEVTNLTNACETVQANHNEASLAIEQYIGERDALLVEKAALEASIAVLKVQKDTEANNYEAKLAETRESLDTTEDKLQSSLGEIERLQYDLKAADKDHSLREEELKFSLAEEQEQKKSAIATFEAMVGDLEQ